jgi:hypothetical protein
MSENPRGTCQECQGWFALTRAGMVWTHKGRETPLCPGSGTAPTMTEKDTMASLPTGPAGHVHRYEYMDDENGHAGEFCTVCAAPGPSPLDSRTRVPQARASAPVEPADDVLMQPDPVKRAEPKRDGWGRYLLPHPGTGKRQAWTRATTFANSVSDTFALSQWSQRMAFKGAALRPDLVSLAHGLDVKADRDKLNKLVEQAKEAAGQKVAANLGTALHSFTEAIDRGGSLGDIPPQHVPDVHAYTAALHSEGMEPVPHLIERITAVPHLGVAGTFDRILRLPDGTHAIGDLKTGADLKYSWHEIVIQLALYAHGVNQVGLWDPEKEEWQGPRSYGDSLETGPWDVPEVRTDFGIVMHLPVGKAQCTLYRVDLVQGWEAAQLCLSVRKWRAVKGLAEPIPLPVEEETPLLGLLRAEVGPMETIGPRLDWERLFATAESREGLAFLFDAAAAQSLGEARMRELTRIGMQRLADLEG